MSCNSSVYVHGKVNFKCVEKQGGAGEVRGLFRLFKCELFSFTHNDVTHSAVRSLVYRSLEFRLSPIEAVAVSVSSVKCHRDVSRPSAPPQLSRLHRHHGGSVPHG